MVPQRRARFRLLHALAHPALVLLAGLGVGCGGSGGGSPQPAPIVTKSVVAPPEDSRDGWVRSDGITSTSGCGEAGDYDDISAGLSVRTFLSFDLSVLPAGKTLVGATLVVATMGNLVEDPFNEHGGAPLVDHVNFGSALTGSDYAAAALTSAFGILPQVGTVAGDHYRLLDVTAAVQADLAASRVRSQFRIRFAIASNLDGTRQVRLFMLADVACASVVAGFFGPPLLVLEYIP